MVIVGIRGAKISELNSIASDPDSKFVIFLEFAMLLSYWTILSPLCKPACDASQADLGFDHCLTDAINQLSSNPGRL